MDHPLIDTIEFDHEEREVLIKNNLPLYRLIKNGKMLVVILVALGEYAEIVDGVAGLITALSEVLYQYISEGWDLIPCRAISASGKAVATGSVKLSIE